MARLNSVSGFFNYKVVKGFRSKSSSIGDRVAEAKPHRALFDSCIQIEEIKINRNTSIPYQINFRLNLATLKHLEAIKHNNQKLLLSGAKIANLRFYVLHKVFAQQIANSKFRRLSYLKQSPLTFSTHYASVNQQPTILLQSAIDLKGQPFFPQIRRGFSYPTFQGKISQQIQRDLYQNPQMLARISQIHYWLISELIAQLPLKSKKSSCLFLGYSSVVTILFGLISWYLSPFNKLLNLIIVFSFLGILNARFKKTIVESIKSWLIYHLVEGFLAKNVRMRQIGLQLLSWLV